MLIVSKLVEVVKNSNVSMVRGNLIVRRDATFSPVLPPHTTTVTFIEYIALRDGG